MQLFYKSVCISAFDEDDNDDAVETTIKQFKEKLWGIKRIKITIRRDFIQKLVVGWFLESVIHTLSQKPSCPF